MTNYIQQVTLVRYIIIHHNNVACNGPLMLKRCEIVIK